jgi:hypothetical protein
VHHNERRHCAWLTVTKLVINDNEGTLMFPTFLFVDQTPVNRRTERISSRRTCGKRNEFRRDTGTFSGDCDGQGNIV